MREIVGVLYSIVEVLETIAGYLEPASAGTTSVQGDTREAEQTDEPKEEGPKEEEPKVEEVVVKKAARSK